MTWSYLRWLAILVTILVFQSEFTAAAPNPNGEEVMRELLKLDQIYSSVARPRFGKRTHNNPHYAPLDYESQYQRTDQELADWLPDRR